MMVDESTGGVTAEDVDAAFASAKLVELSVADSDVGLDGAALDAMSLEELVVVPVTEVSVTAKLEDDTDIAVGICAEGSESDKVAVLSTADEESVAPDEVEAPTDEVDV
jgi:hypothetical protein